MNVFDKRGSIAARVVERKHGNRSGIKNTFLRRQKDIDTRKKMRTVVGVVLKIRLVKHDECTGNIGFHEKIHSFFKKDGAIMQKCTCLQYKWKNKG